jgi:hypothetical protein
MQERDKDREPDPNRMEPVQRRTASFWILIIADGAPDHAGVQPAAAAAGGADVHGVQPQLDAGNVEEVTVIDGKRLEGDAAPAGPKDQSGPGPGVLDAAAHPRQRGDPRAAGGQRMCRSRGAEARQNWWIMMLQALPWLLIIGFWIFMLRRCRRAARRRSSSASRRRGC